MIYCDTSLLVSALTAEVRSTEAASWLATKAAAVIISDWTLPEFASALAVKQRQGSIDGVMRAKIEVNWRALLGSLRLIEVQPVHFARASDLVDSPPRGLRAADALHLAIVLDQGCELATFDRDMADAARALGVAVHPG